MKRKKFNKEPFKGIQLDMAPRDKKTVQQHDWFGPFGFSTEVAYIYCHHCKCKKKFEFGEWCYMAAGKSDWQINEPECITRKTNEHEFSR